MKLFLSLLFLFSACSFVSADPTPEEENFISVPEAIADSMVSLRPEQFATRAFTKKLQEALNGWSGFFNLEGDLPEKLTGYSADLNGDGKKEYFFKTNGGGSGGPAYLAMAEIKGEWSVIADFQGHFCFLEKKNGWNPIVYRSRGGAGHWIKVQLEFFNNSYREVWIDRYNDGEITHELISNKQLDAFLAVSGSIFSSLDIKEQEFKSQELPKKLLEYLSKIYWGDENAKLPDSFNGYEADLNGDGKNEYLVRTRWGNSSGPVYLALLENEGGDWSQIGNFQGDFFLFPLKDGWCPIVSILRGDCDSYVKLLQEFSGGHYRSVWRKRYADGAITKNDTASEMN